MTDFYLVPQGTVYVIKWEELASESFYKDCGPALLFLNPVDYELVWFYSI